MPANNITIGIDARPAKTGAADVKRSFDIIRDSATKATTGVTGTEQSFKKLSTHALSLRTALLGLAGVMGTGFALRDLRSSLSQFEDLQSALTMTTGSVQQAAIEYEFLNDTANRLGLRVTDVQDSFLRLTASTQNSALAGQATRDAFLAVSQATASMGLSSNQASTALDSLARMARLTHVPVKLLQDQFAQAIPGSFAATAKAMGYTNEQLGQLLKQGQIASKDLIPAITKALSDLHEEAANDNINSLNGSMAVLENTIERFKLNIGEGGLKQAFVDFNHVLIDTLSGNDKLAEQIGGVLSSGLNTLGSTLKIVADNFDILKFATLGWLAVVAGNKISVAVAAIDKHRLKTLVLTEAQVANTVATNAATKATTRYSVVTGKAITNVDTLTARTRAARVATLGLNGALSLLGGPIGILAITGFSLYQLAKSVEAANDAQLINIESLETTKSLYSDLHGLSEQAISDNLGEAQSILTKSRAELTALKVSQDEQLSNTPLNPNNNVGVLGVSAINAAKRTQIKSEFATQIAQATAEIDEAEKAIGALQGAQSQLEQQSETAQIEQASIISTNTQKQIDALKLETEHLTALKTAYGEGETARAALINQYQAQIAIQQLGIDANSSEAQTLITLVEQRNTLTTSLRELDAEEQERLRLLDAIKSPLDQLMAQEQRLIELRKADLVSLSEYRQVLKDINREKLYFSTDGIDGMKRALLDYQDVIEDTSQKTENLLSNAFRGAEDALTEFLTTGKASFRDFTQSLLQDIARLAIQQTLISGLLGAIPGFGLANAATDVGSGIANTANHMQGLNEPPMIEQASITPLSIVPVIHPSTESRPVTINTTVNVSGNAGISANQDDPEQASRLATEISQTIKAEVVQIIYEQKRPGGALY